MIVTELNRQNAARIALKKQLRTLFKNYGGKLRWDEPLARYTSLKVGGPADLMVFPRSVAEVSTLMQTLSKHRLPYFVLGGGSNLLIKSGGIEGVVIHLKHLNRAKRLDATQLQADAGLSYPKLAIYAMEQGLSGLEFAAGIPGMVGGAVVMNAGIPRQETAPLLTSVTLVDKAGESREIPAKALSFAYRSSELPKGVIVSAVFALTPAPPENVEQRMKAYLKRRQETQPLSFSNCGSVFKNPEGLYAGRLIEQAGLKGYQIGDAQISERHGNFIINRGAAQAEDCLALIKKMQETVLDLFGIVLELEVKVIGQDEY